MSDAFGCCAETASAGKIRRKVKRSFRIKRSAEIRFATAAIVRLNDLRRTARKGCLESPRPLSEPLPTSHDRGHSTTVLRTCPRAWCLFKTRLVQSSRLKKGRD